MENKFIKRTPYEILKNDILHCKGLDGLEKLKKIAQIDLEKWYET